MRRSFGLILSFIVSSAALAQTRPATTARGQQPPAAQEQQAKLAIAPPDQNWPTKVYSIRYVDYRYIVNLLAPIGVQVSGEPNLNAISVRGPDKTLAAVDEIVKRFDVAANTPKNVDLTIYVVVASSDGDADTVPAPLRPVIDQLRSVMAYKAYRVVDTIIARGIEGSQILSSGSISKLSDTDRADPTYDFRVRTRVAGEGADEIMHLDNLLFTAQVFPVGNNQTLNIGTSVDVKKGQQVVVGKATVRDRAIILILSGKVVD